MSDFAKLFRVGQYQLLVFIEDDQEKDDHSILHQMVDLDGARMDLAMKGPTSAMEKLFDLYDNLAGQNFFTLEFVKKTFKSFNLTLPETPGDDPETKVVGLLKDTKRPAPRSFLEQ